jgi:hypothetical protein
MASNVGPPASSSENGPPIATTVSPAPGIVAPMLGPELKMYWSVVVIQKPPPATDEPDEPISPLFCSCRITRLRSKSKLLGVVAAVNPPRRPGRSLGGSPAVVPAMPRSSSTDARPPASHAQRRRVSIRL